MALNIVKFNHLASLGLKGLKLSVQRIVVLMWRAGKRHVCDAEKWESKDVPVRGGREQWGRKTKVVARQRRSIERAPVRL